jgi:hypothetical protein
LPEKRSPLLHGQLACLQDAASGEAVFRRDHRRLGKLLSGLGPESPTCVRRSARRIAACS